MMDDHEDARRPFLHRDSARATATHQAGERGTDLEMQEAGRVFASLSEDARSRLFAEHVRGSFNISRLTLRRIMLCMVGLALAAYIALIVWGVLVTPYDIAQRGLPSLSDMLSYSHAVTVYYVVVVALFGETRVFWTILYVLDSHVPLQVKREAKSRTSCKLSLSFWARFLTMAATTVGVAQIVFLLIIGVLPVNSPSGNITRDHVIVASMAALMSLFQAILLMLRRELLFFLYTRRPLNQTVFGHQHWRFFRALCVLNIVAMLVSGLVFGALEAGSAVVRNSAIAEYIMFLTIILDTAFRVLDTGVP
jgi:hypothetical protein